MVKILCNVLIDALMLITQIMALVQNALKFVVIAAHPQYVFLVNKVPI